MNRTQVRVLEEAHQVRFRRLLQSHERGRLPAEVVRREALLDLPDEPREGQLPQQQVGTALVLADLFQRRLARS